MIRMVQSHLTCQPVSEDHHETDVSKQAGCHCQSACCPRGTFMSQTGTNINATYKS